MTQTVSHVRGDGKGAFFANAHSYKALIPTFDHLSNANYKEWVNQTNQQIPRERVARVKGRGWPRSWLCYMSASALVGRKATATRIRVVPRIEFVAVGEQLSGLQGRRGLLVTRVDREACRNLTHVMNVDRVTLLCFDIAVRGCERRLDFQLCRLRRHEYSKSKER